MMLFALLIATLVVAAPTFAFAHTPHDEIGWVRLASSFWSDGTLFAIARDNLLASLDGGATWGHLTRGLPYSRIRALALSASFALDRRVVLAADCGIYASDDAGRSWRAARWSAPIGEVRISVRDVQPRPVIKLEADPVASSGAMLCIFEGALHASSDRGASWRVVEAAPGPWSAICVGDGEGYAGSATGELVRLDLSAHDATPTHRWQLGARVPIRSLAMCSDPQQLIIGTLGEGIWRLGDDTGPVPLGLERLRITGVWAERARSPERSSGSRLLCATEWQRGVYVSSDWGASWSLRSHGLSRDAQADHPAFRAPHFSSIDGSTRADGRRALFVAGFDGLFRSDDAGLSWRELEGLVPRDIVVGLATAEEKGTPSRVAVSLYGGGLHLLEGSRSAVSVAAHLRRRRTFAVARLPAGPGAETWVALHDAVSVLRDGADRPTMIPLRATGSERQRLGSWLRRRLAVPAKQLLERAPSALRNRLRVFLQQRATELGMEVGVDVFGSVLRASPTYRADHTAFLSTWRGGLYRTTDGGRSFRHVGAPSSGAWTLGIDLSPSFAKNGRVYVAAENGLWIATQQGEAWSPCALHEWSGEVFRVSAGASRTDGELLFVSTPRALLRARMHPSGAPMSWQPVMECARGCIVTEVALAPDFARSGIALVNQAGIGVLRSSDRGGSFAPVRYLGQPFERDCAHMPGFPDAAPLIVFSPGFAADGIAYAASGTDVLISRDRGESWKRWCNFVDERAVAAGDERSHVA